MTDRDRATDDGHAIRQYEALGRFVEAFEHMVDDARCACMDIVSNLSGELEHEHTHRLLLHIVFHHQIMTAKPLFEIMRAMISELLKNDEFRTRHVIDDTDCATFHGAMKLINSEYTALS